jgi:hypothetical protein
MVYSLVSKFDSGRVLSLTLEIEVTPETWAAWMPTFPSTYPLHLSVVMTIGRIFNGRMICSLVSKFDSGAFLNSNLVDAEMNTPNRWAAWLQRVGSMATKGGQHGTPPLKRGRFRHLPIPGLHGQQRAACEKIIKVSSM